MDGYKWFKLPVLCVLEKTAAGSCGENVQFKAAHVGRWSLNFHLFNDQRRKFVESGGFKKCNFS